MLCNLMAQHDFLAPFFSVGMQRGQGHTIRATVRSPNCWNSISNISAKLWNSETRQLWIPLIRLFVHLGAKSWSNPNKNNKNNKPNETKTSIPAAKRVAASLGWGPGSLVVEALSLTSFFQLAPWILLLLPPFEEEERGQQQQRQLSPGISFGGLFLSCKGEFHK